MLAVGGAAAQEPRVRRIGVLHEAFAANHPAVEGLRAGLRERGLEEGRNLAFDVRFTQGKAEAVSAAAAALVKSGVDVIFTCGEASTLAAKAATSRIPIVFALVGDPITADVVKTLAHPEANVTGVSSLTTNLVPKRLELLKTLVPKLHRVWVIHHDADRSSSAAISRAIETAPRLRLDVVPRPVMTPDQFESVVKQIKPGDAILAPDIETMDIPALLLEASLASRIPVVFSSELWVAHGGLASYGADYRAQGVQAARLVAKILGGVRPRDLPVEGAERIVLSVNVKSADALGITIPRAIMFRADTVRR